MKINLLVIAVVSIFTGFLSYPVEAQDRVNADKQTVVLTETGFSPSSISVPVGTTVTFKTVRGRYFWPASNDHPSHTKLPEFDPKRPVSPEESWEHRFDALGSWGFHDHISPYFTGVITVTEGVEQPHNRVISSIITFIQSIKTYLNNIYVRNFAVIDTDKCLKLVDDRSARIGCWEKIIIQLVQRKGLIAALDFIEKQKTADVAFASDCHVYSHRVGEEYYWQFSQKKKIEISDKFGICDLGFFHGFMQEFTSHSQGLTEAKRYCDLVVSHMKKSEYPGSLQEQCYHGIGHGLTFLYASYYWGENDTIMEHGRADCHTLVPDEPRECINGVYGGMAAMHWGLHGFTLKMDLADPFAICKNQPKEYVSGCFDQFVPVLFGDTNLDLLTTGRIIEKITDDEIAGVAMQHAGSMPSYSLVPKTDDYSSVVATCRKFRAPLDMRCFIGFAGAVLRIGSLEQGATRAKTFCQSSILTKEEQIACFSAVHHEITFKYSKEDAAAFCAGLDSQYEITECKAH